MATFDVCIVGGGLSGSSLAFLLKQKGVRVHLVESSARLGGSIRSERLDGYLCEWGPGSFLDNEPATFDLIDALDLRGQLLAANEAASERWVVRRGRLRSLPSGPKSFVRSDVLSLRGKLRVLLESRQPVRHDHSDESVFDFAARRLGREAAEVLVDAMVNGIYAGDPRQLSLSCTFPRLIEMEKQHGGLFKALRAREGAGLLRGRLHSFKGGMETLVTSLAANLAGETRTGTRITSIRPGWKLETDTGEIECRHLVLALPAWSAAPLVYDFDEALALDLSAIPSAPVAVVGLGYTPQAARQIPPGFGFLVPHIEKLPLLGVLYESHSFSHRAPPEHALVRVMVGGSRDRTAVQESDEELLQRATRSLEALLGLTLKPELTRVVRHKRGIPQYDLPHRERLQRLEERCRDHAGLHLVGYSYRGVAMNACIREATHLADELFRAL